MGIAPYKYFTFDGESSRDYDVYLTGEGVFDAPERAVEMIEIAGRNGNFALDQGKFNNISITYKAGIVDASESNFADKVSAVRNWLCSKVGYKRLEDDYNPNEYRMGVFMAGVDVDHDDLKTGEFEITFDCKPQRWLTSGETATAVANNGTLTNPTLFDSEPLLAVKGYGNIGFNGYNVVVENALIGDIVLAENVDDEAATVSTISLDLSNANNGDEITVDINKFDPKISIQSTNQSNITYVSNTISGSDTNTSFSTSYSSMYDKSRRYWYFTFQTFVDNLLFNKGTSASVTNTFSGNLVINRLGTNYTVTFSGTQTVDYDGNSTITFTDTYNAACTASFVHRINGYGGWYVNMVTVNSTKSALGNPTYIDCEIGECWFESGGQIVPLNNVISLGSDLPKLAPDANTFTYDNTVTELKVTPRWWKV